jgi:hypothetical protein
MSRLSRGLVISGTVGIANPRFEVDPNGPRWRWRNTSMRDHSTSRRILPNLEIIDLPPSPEPT